MQSLEVISVNLWQILISLVNLFLLFLILKAFLYRPVKNVLKKRAEELDSTYLAADKTQREAEEARAHWEEKLSEADMEAEAILQAATANAKARGDEIIADATARADAIVRTAEADAALERKKAVDGIKREIVAVSGVLTEKMLEREINTEDHRALIDSVIEEIGE